MAALIRRKGQVAFKAIAFKLAALRRDIVYCLASQAVCRTARPLVAGETAASIRFSWYAQGRHYRDSVKMDLMDNPTALANNGGTARPIRRGLRGHNALYGQIFSRISCQLATTRQEYLSNCRPA